MQPLVPTLPPPITPPPLASLLLSKPHRSASPPYPMQFPLLLGTLPATRGRVEALELTPDARRVKRPPRAAPNSLPASQLITSDDPTVCKTTPPFNSPAQQPYKKRCKGGGGAQSRPSQTRLHSVSDVLLRAQPKAKEPVSYTHLTLPTKA